MEALAAELQALIERHSFSRRAIVNLWGVRSSHQNLLLPSDRPSELESMARHRGARTLGISEADVTVSSTIGATWGEPGHHPKTEVSFFAAPSLEIRDRLHPFEEAGFQVEGVTSPCAALWSQARLRRPSVPGEVHAVVALSQSQSALAVFGDGALLYARDLDWGYGGPAETADPQGCEVFAARLSSELRRSFLHLKQDWEQHVSQVLLCGDMPEIRSLTAPLLEKLNLDVETLDTLEGIETASVPEGFSQRAATYRLASVIAAEPPPVNLLPVKALAVPRHKAGRRILAVGIAAAVAFGVFHYAQVVRRRDEAARQVAPSERGMTTPQSGPDRAAVNEDRPEPVVTGILFSSGRRLALVDGRIVAPGDRVGIGVIRSIEPEAVIVASDQGETRRVAIDRRRFVRRGSERY